MLGFTVTILMLIIWQAMQRYREAQRAGIDSLEKVMNAKFEAQTQGLLRVEQVVDARLKHLEAAALTPEQRSERARRAAAIRWANKKNEG